MKPAFYRFALPLAVLGLIPMTLIPVLAQAQSKVQAPVIETVTVERRNIAENLSLLGSLGSPHTARLAPDVEGRLVSIEVDAGARVRTGDVLFSLDDELARLELAQAIAAEHEAEADLADARRRVVEARELVAKNTFPESEARSLEALVTRNRAILERRRAERAFAAAKLAHYRLSAPFDGVIASREADPGERVDSDSNVLLLVATDELQLDLRVPQQYFQRVEVGTPVTLRLDALPGQTLESGVAMIVPVSDPDARTFLVRTRIDNRAGKLTPGMSVRALLRLGTDRQTEVVPRDALLRHPDGRTVVWVASVDGEDYVVHERLVKSGLTFDGTVEILEGLAVGELVVIRGNENLREGQKVRLIGES